MEIVISIGFKYAQSQKLSTKLRVLMKAITFSRNLFFEQSGGSISYVLDLYLGLSEDRFITTGTDIAARCTPG